MSEEELKAAIRYGLKWYCVFWGSIIGGFGLLHGILALL